MARVVRLLSLPVALLCLFEGRASAFEREWHFGAGVGIAAANGYKAGPAANLYGAYGISDVFDLRLELLGSSHIVNRYRSDYPDPSTFYGGKLALAYKVDVIQWIPYLGLSVGFLGVTKSESIVIPPRDPIPPFATAQPTAGLLLGLDYAATRNLGLGGAVSYDFANTGAAYAAALLRAEYRFGF